VCNDCDLREGILAFPPPEQDPAAALPAPGPVISTPDDDEE
jgi:hypothetical protein